MASRKGKNKGGRPTVCTPELRQAVCYRLLEGESLRSICTDDAMPARSTVLEWLSGAWPDGDPREGFPGQYARAREAQAELYADDIIEIADNADEDKIDVARLKIDARKWVVTRLLPRYAKKVVHEGGEKPIPVKLDVREAARRIVHILNQADPKKKS